VTKKAGLKMRIGMSRSKPLLFSWIFLVVLAGIWWGAFKLIEHDREEMVHEAKLATRHLSGVYEGQMVRALHDIDLTINVARYACEHMGWEVALRDLDAELLVPSSLMFVVTIADHNGRVVASNEINRATSVRDQPYFRYFQDPVQAHTGDVLYIGSVTFDPVAQKRLMHFARRISGPQGLFAGVVSVVIDPAYFISGYDAMRMGKRGALGVVGPDGQLLAWRSGDHVSMGGGLLPKARSDLDASADVMKSPWDGVRRYTLFKQLSAFPMGVVVGLSEDEQLSRLKDATRTRYGQAGIVSVLLASLALLTWLLDRSRARIRKTQETYHAASEASLDATFVLHSVCDVSGAVVDFVLVDVNGRGLTLTGRSRDAVLGKSLRMLVPDVDSSDMFAVLRQVVQTGTNFDAERENTWPGIPAQWFHVQVIKASDGVVAIARDISERKRSEAELVRRNAELTDVNRELTHAHEQLVQSEKLASIGLLAAGVAHEINNPVGFVMSNIGTLDGYLKALFELLDAYKICEPAISDPDLVRQLAALCEQIEPDYLREDIPALMRETKDGIDRVRRIVQDLKDFSHVDSQQEWQLSNLHAGIDSTLNVVNNEIKYKADVVKHYGEIDAVECLPSQINQVFMNLLVNAAHAMGDGRGTITISTGQQGDEVWVEVADSGCGISPANMARIFDPFFTTKPIGKGTGLGLSLSYGIVKKHGGRLEVRSELGQGTTFRMTLPKAQIKHVEALTQQPA
jgi:two-component system NtrC family sensor kinase